MGKSKSNDSLVDFLLNCNRWSSVYPTYGAFWGIGIGLGCGVGWGPGFGPDVVGYAGGGCGLGFSVGVTAIGFGIGVPATGLACLPYNLFLRTSKEARQKAVSHVIPALILAAQLCWNAVGFPTFAIERDFQNVSQKTSTIRKDLRNFSDSVCVPTGSKLCYSLQKSVMKGVEAIKSLKVLTTRKLTYRFQMKQLRGLPHVHSKHVTFEKVADPRVLQEIPARVSLVYVVDPQESCGQVVRFSKTFKCFKKYAMSKNGDRAFRPRDRIPYILPRR